LNKIFNKKSVSSHTSLERGNNNKKKALNEKNSNKSEISQIDSMKSEFGEESDSKFNKYIAKNGIIY